MALGLTQSDTKSGAATTYIRIDDLLLPNLLNGGVVKVGYYVDGNMAKTLLPVSSTTILLTDAECAVLRNQGLALLYGILKARPEFSGAADV